MKKKIVLIIGIVLAVLIVVSGLFLATANTRKYNNNEAIIKIINKNINVCISFELYMSFLVTGSV